MPEVRRYVVTQVREVVVEANSAAASIQHAKAAFNEGKMSTPAVWGRCTSNVRETSLKSEEVR